MKHERKKKYSRRERGFRRIYGEQRKRKMGREKEEEGEE